MRTRFLVYLLITALLGTSYWYVSTENVCPIPLSYRIGTIDEGFAITEMEAIANIAAAEAAWEEATGRDLFRYDDTSNFTINFIFDDRQAMADDEAMRSAALDQQRADNIAFFEGIEELELTYDQLATAYENQIVAYENRLQTYNQTVSRYNDQGGAPANEFERLQREQEALDAEAEALQARATELNELANRINTLGAEGNRLIDAYNRQVAAFNRDFGYSREFTQGEYRGDRINIYKFSSDAELNTVLAHELGHALGIDHVADDQALMYYLLTDVSENPRLTDADKAAFARACASEGSFGHELRQLIRQVLTNF